MNATQTTHETLTQLATLILVDVAAARATCTSWRRWNDLNGSCVQRIAQELGCSVDAVAMPARHALDMLVQHGLVEVNCGYGANVRLTQAGQAVASRCNDTINA